MSIFRTIRDEMGEISTWGGVAALATGVNGMLTEIGAAGAADKAGRAAEAAVEAGTMIAGGLHPLVAIGLTILGAFGILSPTSKRSASNGQ
ncbi:MAG: hypothetical protein ACX939_07440 [Hyphococcus sp.]